MLSRRELGGKMAAGAAVVVATGLATKAGGKTAPDLQPDEVAESADSSVKAIRPTSEKELDCGIDQEVEAKAPWQLLHPLSVGSAVGSGWKLAALTGAVSGSCVVTLENERGRQSRVHIFRNDGSPQGLVYTRNFDLVVMNGGIGDLETEESLAQAVAELSHTLASNESAGRQVVASLVPHAERMRDTAGSPDRGLR